MNHYSSIQTLNQLPVQLSHAKQQTTNSRILRSLLKYLVFCTLGLNLSKNSSIEHSPGSIHAPGCNSGLPEVPLDREIGMKRFLSQLREADILNQGLCGDEDVRNGKQKYDVGVRLICAVTL